MNQKATFKGFSWNEQRNEVDLKVSRDYSKKAENVVHVVEHNCAN